MSKLIIVLSIFALVILMIQNFKLKRNIRETEKTIDELEALYSNTMDYIDHMEENKEVLVKEDLIEIYQTYKP